MRYKYFRPRTRFLWVVIKKMEVRNGPYQFCTLRRAFPNKYRESHKVTYKACSLPFTRGKSLKRLWYLSSSNFHHGGTEIRLSPLFFISSLTSLFFVPRVTKSKLREKPSRLANSSKSRVNHDFAHVRTFQRNYDDRRALCFLAL